MKYELLSKYYYTDKELYEQLFLERRDNISSIHYDISIKENQAFVVIIPQITKLLISIYKNNTRLEMISRELPQVAKTKYLTNCLIDEIMITNDIEGIYSTRKEINTVLQNRSQEKKLRFEGLVKKYLLLIEKNNEIEIKTCEDIRKLYDEIVLDEISEKELKPDGEIFRKDLATVISATQKIKHQGVSSEVKIIEHMRKALDILNERGGFSLINIAVFHYLLGYIHPFYDGNGRLNRFISSSFLTKELNAMTAYRLSYAIKEDKGAYYRAFDACNDLKNRGDLTPFVVMFLERINFAVEDLKDKMLDGYNKLEYFRTQLQNSKTLKQELNKVLFILIQDALFCNEGVTRREMADNLDVSYQTVTSEIENLKRIGIKIEQRKVGKPIAYYIELDELENYLIQEEKNAK